jgi:hypothetical protein
LLSWFIKLFLWFLEKRDSTILRKPCDDFLWILLVALEDLQMIVPWSASPRL